MDKSLRQLTDKVLTQEYNKLYGSSDKTQIARLKLVIDEFAKRKIPLPGSARAKEADNTKKSKVVYKPKKVKRGTFGKAVIADSDKRISTIIATQMRNLRFEPAIYQNGLLAKQEIKKSMPEIIILGNNISGSVSTTLCSQIRALPGGAEVPIIFVSSQVDKKTVMAAMMSGISEFVKRPFDVKDFAERIKKLINYEDLLKQEKDAIKAKEEERKNKENIESEAAESASKDKQ